MDSPPLTPRSSSSLGNVSHCSEFFFYTFEVTCVTIAGTTVIFEASNMSTIGDLRTFVEGVWSWPPSAVHRTVTLIHRESVLEMTHDSQLLCERFQHELLEGLTIGMAMTRL